MGNVSPELLKSRLSIILVIVLCALPFIAATIAFKMGWRPQGKINHGDLIQPARPLVDQKFINLQKKVVGLKDLKGKWNMVFVAGSRCNKACLKSLYKMRQVRLTQGKHLKRLQNVYIYYRQGAPSAKMIKEYPFSYWRADQKSIRQLVKQLALPKNSGTPLDGQARIYMVDPLGNFFMFYPQDADATGIRKDLERLLRISKIG